MQAVTSCWFAKCGTQLWAGVETVCDRKMSESGVLELSLSSYMAGPWFLMSFPWPTELKGETSQNDSAKVVELEWRESAVGG